MPIIKFKNSVTTSSVPGSGTLQPGEPAFNIADQRAWVGNSSNNPVKIIGNIAQQESNNVSISGGTVTVSTYSSSAVTGSQLTLGGTAVTQSTGAFDGTSNSVLVSEAGAKYMADKKLKDRLVGVYVYSGSGTYTYTKSGPEVQTLHVLLCGGGGGARAYSECGGGGGFSEGIITATSITTVTVTIGGGGSGGSYFGFSPDGGTTSFGAYLSAGGGYGANRNTQHSGGHGGIGYGGSINTYGGMGGSHNNMDQYSTSNASGGIGGGTYFGGCLQGDRPDWSTSSSTAAPGTGGVAIAPNHNGQGGRSGQSGICIVYEYR